MNSQHSNYRNNDNTEYSQSFNLLHEHVQRWIWEQGWTELRDAQEKAIKPILLGSTDVIITATTASGKTEAAFLPIGSKLIGNLGSSIKVLYISPLKALINDQFQRLDLFFERINIPVHRWHGDVPQGQKSRTLRDPSGLLLITPESLEAIFVNHGTTIGRIFNELNYVVIDELHSFIGTERGRQLQSLLHRIEIVLERKVPRIALSATLGDMNKAREFLRKKESFPCELIESTANNQTLKLQIRGYLVESENIPIEANDENESSTIQSISKHLYTSLRGTTSLIFTNRRSEVEVYADCLKRLSDNDSMPNEFFPHHGSLSKTIREEVESMLKDTNFPTTAICTSTLEMGIDIGSIENVAQIGSPFSVSSLRQRLGRSGRRGQPAVLRIYIQEEEISANTPPQNRLRSDLVQSIAIINLLLQGWYEPPITTRLHLSTLIQQILSMIAQYGGVKTIQIWRVLCHSGQFSGIDQPMLMELLRSLGTTEIITQASDGTLVLGAKGEKIVNHFNFYAAFNVSQEYQLINGGVILGSLPISYPLIIGAYLIFAGKRWEVIHIDDIKKVIELKPSVGGRAPKFGGSGYTIPDRIREEMRSVYLGSALPVFLDERAQALLVEARENFFRFNLDTNWLIQNGKDVLIFLWKGDQIMNTLQIQLQADGFKVSNEGITLNVSDTNIALLKGYIENLIIKGFRHSIDLASTVKNKLQEKYDYYLTENLLNAEYAARNLDTHKTVETLRGLFVSKD